jgi:hypothetical protein
MGRFVAADDRLVEQESRQARTISNTMPNFGGRRITRSKNAMVQPYLTLSLGRY